MSYTQDFLIPSDHSVDLAVAIGGNCDLVEFAHNGHMVCLHMQNTFYHRTRSITCRTRFITEHILSQNTFYHRTHSIASRTRSITLYHIACICVRGGMCLECYDAFNACFVGNFACFDALNAVIRHILHTYSYLREHIMYLCIYICMYVFVCVFMYLFICLCIHVCMYVCIPSCMYLYIAHVGKLGVFWSLQRMYVCIH